MRANGVKNATNPVLIAAIIGEALMSGEAPPSIVELITMTQAELWKYLIPREDRCRDFLADLAERTHGSLGALAAKKLYQVRGTPRRGMA